jgi:hypothetical protein
MLKSQWQKSADATSDVPLILLQPAGKSRVSNVADWHSARDVHSYKPPQAANIGFVPCVLFATRPIVRWARLWCSISIHSRAVRVPINKPPMHSALVVGQVVLFRQRARWRFTMHCGVDTFSVLWLSTSWSKVVHWWIISTICLCVAPRHLLACCLKSCRTLRSCTTVLILVCSLVH